MLDLVSVVTGSNEPHRAPHRGAVWQVTVVCTPKEPILRRQKMCRLAKVMEARPLALVKTDDQSWTSWAINDSLLSISVSVECC